MTAASFHLSADDPLVPQLEEIVGSEATLTVELRDGSVIILNGMTMKLTPEGDLVKVSFDG